MVNKLYFLSGNARTFLKCFDSFCNNIVNNLFENNNKENTYLLLYLKCDDPGPKGQKNWNFSYKKININELKQKIDIFEKKYNYIKFNIHIMETNEISDDKLIKKIKDRTKYIDFLDNDKKLIRALHFFYNLERCGYLINNIEKENNIKFDYFIYTRPDIYFQSKCLNIKNYNSNKVILSHNYTHDHFAIIPKKFKDDFLFNRMKFISENDTYYMKQSENIYLKTIEFEITNICKFVIKRK